VSICSTYFAVLCCAMLCSALPCNASAGRLCRHLKIIFDLSSRRGCKAFVRGCRCELMLVTSPSQKASLLPSTCSRHVANEVQRLCGSLAPKHTTVLPHVRNRPVPACHSARLDRAICMCNLRRLGGDAGYVPCVSLGYWGPGALAGL